MLIITASNIMRREIAVLREEDNLEHVARCMQVADLRQVAVVDGQRLVGMLDERDMAHLQARNQTRASQRLSARLCERTFVAQIMRRNVPTVRAHASINEVLLRLAGYRCDTVFVVDDDHNLVGIVTRKEVSSFVELVLMRASMAAQRRVDRRVRATKQRLAGQQPSQQARTRRIPTQQMPFRQMPSLQMQSESPAPRRRKGGTLNGVGSGPQPGETLIGMCIIDDEPLSSPSPRRRVA